MTAAAPAPHSAGPGHQQAARSGANGPTPALATGNCAYAAALHSLKRRTYHKNDELYSRNMPAAAAFVIETGLVALSLGPLAGSDRLVAVAGPSDVIGQVAPSLTEYQDSAVALSSEVTVRAISGPEQPAFAWLLEAAAGAHIIRLTNALEDAALPVPARVARAIVRLGDKFGQRTANGNTRLTLPITHETLAAMVGAARETTTSTIQRLRAEGLLQGTRGSYQYRPESLAEYADQVTLTRG